MTAYCVYGKRTAPEHWDSISRSMIPQDKQFRAVNDRGVRVNKLEEAIMFASKEDAQEWLNKKLEGSGAKDGVVWDIRKVNN